MYAWLYTVTGLCLLGCTLLQGNMCVSAHCYRIVYASESYCIYPNVRQPCVCVCVCETVSLHNLQFSGGYLYKSSLRICYNVTLLPCTDFSVDNLGGK